MPKRIHFLNVEDGDCSIIERPDSGRHTMIDICCGNLETEAGVTESVANADVSKSDRPKGNFNQKSNPTNPIEYLNSIGIKSIHRFILTHPDMDHMDGLNALFNSVKVSNFWDSGVERDEPDFSRGKYKKEDWDFYKKLKAKSVENVTTISPKAGDKSQYWAHDDEKKQGNGDYLSIIAPTKELVTNCNGNINDASYVVVYRSQAGKIIFPGDSEDATWEYILENHEDLVKDAAILFAPHHGRDSDRDWSFLDVVNPRISFLGNAKSKFLGYKAWANRGLTYFTNNQCGNIRANFNGDKVVISIENKEYASQYTNQQTYEIDGYWFLIEV